MTTGNPQERLDQHDDILDKFIDELRNVIGATDRLMREAFDEPFTTATDATASADNAASEEPNVSTDDDTEDDTEE